MGVGPKMMCPECRQVLQSTHRHDWVACTCTNRAFVDGGDAYLRTGAMRSMPVPYVEPGPTTP